MRLDTKTLRQAIESYSDNLNTFDLTRSVADMRREEALRLMKKWMPFLQENPTLTLNGKSKTFEMEGVPADKWYMLAFLFESQMLHNPLPKNFFEANSRDDIALPAKYTLPLIRAIFPQLIMNKLCLVQPMPPMSGGTMNLYWKATYREDDDDSNVTTDNSLYAKHANPTDVPKRLKIGISTQSATAEEEMLMASWPTSLEEDIRGVMGLDLDQEFINDAAEEIGRELEERVISTMIGSATAGDVDWTPAVPDDFTGSYTENYQRVFHAFIDAEKYVRATQYRACEYIVAGTNILSDMEKANWFGGPVLDNTSGPYRSAVEKIGKKGRWDVYWSPYIDDDQALISFYPESTKLYGGYIWAPYVPFMAMPKIYAEAKAYDDATLPGGLVANDLWTRRVRSRNAQYYAEPAMFATVTRTEAEE